VTVRIDLRDLGWVEGHAVVLGGGSIIGARLAVEAKLPGEAPEEVVFPLPPDGSFRVRVAPETRLTLSVVPGQFRAEASVQTAGPAKGVVLALQPAPHAVFRLADAVSGVLLDPKAGELRATLIDPQGQETVCVVERRHGFHFFHGFEPGVYRLELDGTAGSAAQDLDQVVLGNGRSDLGNILFTESPDE
jgi:hypothetical protein